MRPLSLPNVIRHISAVLILALILGASVEATVPTVDETRRVCENWIAHLSQEGLTWAGVSPQVVSMEELTADGRPVAHCYHVLPRGYVLVPLLREMLPIKAYSDVSDLDVSATDGFTDLVRAVLDSRLRSYERVYGDLQAAQPQRGVVMFPRSNREVWDVLSVEPADFVKGGGPLLSQKDQGGPLLETSWDQGSPFNNYCPMGAGGRCVVGCVATAWAQIIAYHQWPIEGDSSHTYYWWGDDPVPGRDLTADFSDPYDWENMPLSCTWGCEPEQEAAAAELSYEVGVAVHMNYGSSASAAWPGLMIEHLPAFFGYLDTLREIYRGEYTREEWFDSVKVEIDADRPIAYGIVSHEIVCDGYRQNGEILEGHFNYGWNDGHNDWYVFNHLYCPWEGCDSLSEVMIIGTEPDKRCVLAVEPRVGWVPFDVQCTGSSSLEAVSWTWDFGDGDFAYEQSPIHTYEEAGMFDIELEVYDGSQTVSKHRPEYVIALADSLIALDAACKAGDTVEITICARNNVPLSNIWVPLRWAGDLELSWVGYHTQGCRTDYFEDTARLAYSGSGHLAVLELRTCNDGSLPNLEPGAGPVVKVLLAVDAGAEYGQTSPIKVDALGYLPPKFFGDRLEYIARPVQGTVTCMGCCRIRGDVNGSESGPDISDLVYMIGYMFKEGPAPPCLMEADINGSGGDIDVSDLVSLVNFMFKYGDPPEPCP